MSGGTLLALLATNLSILLTRARIHVSAPAAPRLLVGYVISCACVSVAGRLVAMGVLPAWLSIMLPLPVFLLPLGLLLREEF